MANLNGEFDATQVEPAAPMEAVPPGEYVMQVKNSEMKSTKSGNGQYLQLDMEITEGDFKGRMIFERLNLDNPNETAVEIANRTLSAICHAVGVLKVRDSSQLHYKRMLVRVDVEKRDGYSAQNVVKAYKALDGTVAQAAESSSAGATTKKPNWSK
ncbi:hypothetical protein BH10PLA2_BH10PLA2_19890 [soil metagenome]